MKSLFTLLLALAAIISLPAPQAEAQSAPPQTAPAQAGHMRAHGVGSAQFKGAGRLEFRLHGKGVLVIQDAAAHKVKLVGKGKVHTTSEGDLVVQGFKGKVIVTGKGISGGFGKGRIGLIADGKGKAKLKGKGGFKANGTPGKWGVPASTVSW